MRRLMLGVTFCQICKDHHPSHQVHSHRSHKGVRGIMLCDICAGMEVLSGRGCMGCDRELTQQELEVGAYCAQCMDARQRVLKTGQCPCDPSGHGGTAEVVLTDRRNRQHRHVICRRCGGERHVHQNTWRAEW